VNSSKTGYSKSTTQLDSIQIDDDHNYENVSIGLFPFLKEFGKEFQLTGVVKGQQIGSGHFGTVFVGDWNSEKVALKCLKDENGSLNTKPFISEIKLAKTAKSNSVVKVLGVCDLEKQIYVVMEYCPNGSLLEWLRNKAMETTQIELTRIATECCIAVSSLHKQNIIHRDIAARNFLLTSTLRVKLSDFGMAKQTLGGKYYAKSTELPVKWSAPEVILKERFDSKTDAYAIGITMFEIFSKGTVPFVGKSNEAIAECMQSNQELKLFKPEFATEKQYQLILQLTDFDPQKRPKLESVVEELEKPDQIQQQSQKQNDNH